MPGRRVDAANALAAARQALAAAHFLRAHEQPGEARRQAEWALHHLDKLDPDELSSHHRRAWFEIDGELELFDELLDAG